MDIYIYSPIDRLLPIWPPLIWWPKQDSEALQRSWQAEVYCGLSSSWGINPQSIASDHGGHIIVSTFFFLGGGATLFSDKPKWATADPPAIGKMSSHMLTCWCPQLVNGTAGDFRCFQWDKIVTSISSTKTSIGQYHTIRYNYIQYIISFDV